MSDLERLADVLASAQKDHAAEVEALADMDDETIASLANLGRLEDPVTDGLEGRCSRL